MGERKKPKKYGKMNYQQKESYVKSELQKLGGSGVYYQDDGSRGSQNNGMFDLEKSQEQLKKLASNDYDRRESVKYGVDSGDKRFKNIDASSGFDSMSSLVNADRAIAKYGINVLGNNKMKEKDGDYASVSNALFNASRDKFSEGIMSDIDDEQTDAAIKPDENEVPYERSQQSKDAQSTLEKWKAGLGAGGNISPYGSGSPSAPDVPSPYKTESSKPVTTDVDEFVDGYKKDVKSAYNIKPVMS